MAAAESRPCPLELRGRQQDLSTDELIDPRVISRELDEILPAERLVSIDSGNFMGYPSSYLSVSRTSSDSASPRRSSRSASDSPLPSAPPLARPDRLPVLGTGDGGFLMGIAELETAVRERIPLVVIVYNDSGLRRRGPSLRRG